MKKLFLTSIITTVLFALSAQSIQAQSDKKIKAEIDKINAELVQAILANDHQLPLKYYTDDAISMPSYRPMLVGVDAIKKSGEENAASGMKMKEFTLVTVKIIPDTNLIVEIGKYALKMEIPGVPDPISDKGKYITIWEKQADGSLKMKVETWNTDLNPM